jgi:hypothetical protein
MDALCSARSANANQITPNQGAAGGPALRLRRYPHGMDDAAPAQEPAAEAASKPSERMLHFLQEPAREAAARPSGPVWQFLFKPRWLGWHLLMVVSFFGMLWLGDWQFHRAMSGNALSWAYTFEWPLFACFAVVFWAKTIRDEFRIKRGERLGEAPDEIGSLPAAVAAAQIGSVQAGTAGPAEEQDEELSAYNAYLARLNAEVKNHGRWHGLR